jgi:hypothetical protein
MTAINSGYGAIYLTPDHMVDFSDGEGVVTFDMSTQRGSGRDWVDLWISPYEDNLQIPLQDWLPPYQGEPRRAVQIRMDNGEGGTFFRADVVRDFTATEVPGSTRTYESVLTPSASRRDKFALYLSGTHIRFGMPAYDLWWIDSDIADLGWSRGVVQFGHHAYNPTKECSSNCTNTWHWDNIGIEPAAPFTIVRGTPRYVTAETVRDVSFPVSVSGNTSLRFIAAGNNLAVSFDGGANWQPARRQSQKNNKQEHFSSYFTPMPAGVTRVQFRGEESWAGPWMVRDVSIWAQTSVPFAGTPAPIATSVTTPSPAAAPGPVIVNFDDRTGQNQPLTGSYPTGVLDWGESGWYHSGPFGQFTSKSVSFDGTEGASRSVAMVTPRRLVSLAVYNGGSAPTTVTLMCAGHPDTQAVIAVGERRTIQTGWTGTCRTIVIASSNGWDTNFDDLALDDD